ncbi:MULTISPECIES: AraC family transcriptional regulator [unclassified Dyella]|uniref:helix-turn-helix domain-containing protein n=1 Tax=unclassified Dyella TaxID=2634549 RepID=UPI000CA7651A|nr:MULTISPECIES: AraC family transcriptional regulator [unclassified Dyella]MDR3443685.1 AraC family transcriptional regulator [Dyella sp.]PMQ03779.1 Transcriptional activator NphR [Dyella sp. AD56]
MSVERAWRTPCVTAFADEMVHASTTMASDMALVGAVVYPDFGVDLHRRIRAYIDANLGDEALGIASLIRAFGVSRSTLCRLFGDEGGVSRYIRQRRLGYAYKHLMEEPRCSITWLLYELGFASERQFQRAFHATYGISPAQWRKRCRGTCLQAQAACIEQGEGDGDELYDTTMASEGITFASDRMRRNAGCGSKP